MLKKFFATVIVITVCVMLIPLTASALLVTGSDLTGSRTTPETSGVVAADGWADGQGGFKIAWDISQSGSEWTYKYWLTDKDDSVLDPGLSHWILEVSDTITTSNVGEHIYESNISYTLGDYSGDNPSNPDMPAGIHGIKFEPGDYVEFTSDKAPVWGDFYAKDGRHKYEEAQVWATAWNTGFGTDPINGTEAFTQWIPTPDTVSVPEPCTLMLLGPGLIGIGIYSWRRRKG